MGHLSYEASKKLATKTILILAAITVVEVAFALLGRGYVIPGFHLHWTIVGALMIILSIVKAYLIVYEFMHLKYEVPGMVKSILLPLILLIWGVIAFMYEGDDWEDRRKLIDDKNKEEVSAKPIGMDIRERTAEFRM